MPNPRSRRNLTNKGIAALKKPKPGKRSHAFDVVVPGLAVRVTDRGVKSFVLVTRLHGKQIWVTLGRVGAITLAEAREKGREALSKIEAGKDPRKIDRPAAPNDFRTIADDFIERHAKRHTRTWAETERIFNVYVFPTWGNLPIGEIKRRDVTKLLDTIEDKNGPVMADRVLAAIRKLMNWHVTRDDDFISPIVKGMGRAKPASQRARDRVLTDDEIRALWPLLDSRGAYGGVVKVLFLTAARRDEVRLMSRSEIDGDTWTIPAARDKTGMDKIVPLSKEAITSITTLPQINDSDPVFTVNGRTPFAGLSKAKKKLDADLLAALREAAEKAGDDPDKVTLPQWQLHDIRRTARTLMSRAGVRSEIAERVLGHTIGGVEGTYDRHSYLDEKRDALERLAAMIDRILNPPPANVVKLRDDAR